MEEQTYVARSVVTPLETEKEGYRQHIKADLPSARELYHQIAGYFGIEESEKVNLAVKAFKERFIEDGWVLTNTRLAKKLSSVQTIDQKIQSGDSVEALDQILELVTRFNPRRKVLEYSTKLNSYVSEAAESVNRPKIL